MESGGVEHVRLNRIDRMRLSILITMRNVLWGKVFLVLIHYSAFLAAKAM